MLSAKCDSKYISKEACSGDGITRICDRIRFADGYPWAHIDIAPRMTSIEGDFLAKGAAGAPVRLLVRMLSEM